MFHQRHEACFEIPVTLVFVALLDVAGRRRWAMEPGAALESARPHVGRRYVWHSGSVVRRGRIVECLKPVLLTVYETLLDPPCRVRLRLRWRLEPLEIGTSLLLDARYELNRAAYFNRKRWREQIHGHCDRMLAAVAAVLAERGAQGPGLSGQSMGKSSMTVTNTTAVNGKPSFK